MNSLKGQLLVATPRLVDPNFAQTVLLMLEHSEDGALGVVLNRPTAATVHELSGQVLEEPSDWEKTISIGGPVSGPLIVLHGIAELGDQEVIDGVYSTLDAARIQELIRRQAEPSLIVANYAGWGPGQLESEFETDSWYACATEAAEVFACEDASCWRTIVKRINAGTLAEIAHLRAMPRDPTLN